MKQRQVLWKTRFPSENFSGPGMFEDEKGRVKRLPPESAQGSRRPRSQMVGLGSEMRSIDVVTHQRVAGMGEVDPNLVSAAGGELAGEESGHRFSVLAVEGLPHFPVGDRFPPACTYGHFFASVRVPVYRSVDGAVRAVRQSPDKSQVAASHRSCASVIRELRAQRLVRGVILGGYHEPGGVLIEPMHDAWPADAADAGQALPTMRDERVDQRSGRVACCGMNNQSFRLVDDDEILVLVNDIQRDGFPFRFRRYCRRHVDYDRISRSDMISGIVNWGRADRGLGCTGFFHDTDVARENQGFQA